MWFFFYVFQEALLIRIIIKNDYVNDHTDSMSMDNNRVKQRAWFKQKHIIWGLGAEVFLRRGSKINVLFLYLGDVDAVLERRTSLCSW